MNKQGKIVLISILAAVLGAISSAVIWVVLKIMNLGMDLLWTILPAKLGQIAGMQIEIPRDDRCGIAPSGKAGVHSRLHSFSDKRGDGNRYMAIRILFLFTAQIEQEFLPKGCAVT